MPGSKVIVTGAGGFIGQWVAKNLQQVGYDVTGLARSALEPCSFRAVSGFELGAPSDLSGVLDGADAIVHCAARVHLMDDSVSDPLAEFRRVNVLGTLALARQAAECGVRRFVFISTVKINGEQTLPGEAFSVRCRDAPQDPYGQSKMEAEQGLHKIAQQTGMEVVIIRPPLVYGPGVKGNFLMLLKLANSALPLPFGSIRNRRSMVYVENLVSMIVCVIDHPRAGDRTFLVSDGEDLSTTRLFAEIRRFLGRKNRLFPVPTGLLFFMGTVFGKRAMIDRLCGSLQIDIGYAREVLDWKPPISTRVGLEKTATDFNQSSARRAL